MIKRISLTTADLLHGCNRIRDPDFLVNSAAKQNTPHHMSFSRLYLLGISLLLAAPSLPAQQWVGGTSSDWNTATNWNPAAVPTTSAIINTNSGNMPIIGLGSFVEVDFVFLGFDGNSGANTRLTISDFGNFRGENLFLGIDPGSRGALILSRGHATIPNLFVGLGGVGRVDLSDSSQAQVLNLGISSGSSEQSLVTVRDPGTLLGDVRGLLGVNSSGRMVVRDGAAIEFSLASVNGGGLLQFKQSGIGVFRDALVVFDSGRVEISSGGNVSSRSTTITDSNLVIHGAGSALRSDVSFSALGTSTVSMEKGGTLFTELCFLEDEVSLTMKGNTVLVVSDFFFIAEGASLLLDSHAFAVVDGAAISGFAQARNADSNFFAASINLGTVGTLHASRGGKIWAGGIFGGTILVDGSADARGTVASSVFEGNTILLNGGVLQALENEEEFISGSAPVVLENGGGWIDTQNFTVAVQSLIVGEGDLTKIGSGSLILEGDLEYLGTTHVQEGSLYLRDVSLKGDVQVDPDALFGGSGRVEGNFVNAGILSPGFSPGTLRIARNLTLESTSTLFLEIASRRNYDRIRIDGTARLGGKLQIALLGNFEPSPGDEFAMLKADEIKGSFKTITSIFDAVVVGNELIVVWTGDRRSYQHAADTNNQREVASALEELRTEDFGTDSDFNRNVRPVLDVLSPAQLRQAFDAIAPSQSVAFSSVAFARSKSWLPQMATRLEYARNRPLENNLTSLGAADMKNVVAVTPERLGVWLDGSGVFSQTASFDGLRTGDASAASGTVGVDYKLSEAFTFGGYTGYVGSWTDFGGGSGVDSNGARLGMYSTWQSGGFYLNGLVGGEWNAYDWNRHIVFPGIDRRASADTTGAVFETMFGGGYDWSITDNLKFGVFSGVEYTLLNVEGFTESGAGALDLDIDDQDADSLRSNLGVQGAWSIPVNTRILRPTLAAAWRHEYLDGSRGVGSQLVGGAGPGFNTSIPGSNRKDSLLLSGGFSMELTDDVSGFLYYTGDIAGTADDVHSVNAGLRLQF